MQPTYISTNKLKIINFDSNRIVKINSLLFDPAMLVMPKLHNIFLIFEGQKLAFVKCSYY